jgi:tRNA pseudouridine32 synthase/23S rRNA pseudouridine746 synthase
MRRTPENKLAKQSRPPTKNGVGPSSVSLPAGTWPTIVDFLAERFQRIPRAEWLARVARGEVLNEELVPIAADSGYVPHGTVHYYRHVADEPRIPFQEVVLFQDEYLVVADKPHFLPVISTGRFVQESLLVRLKQTLKLDELAPLHRIDRETAGIVLFAIQPATRSRYMELFRRHTIDKHYEAIAPYRADLQLPTTIRNRLVASEQFMQMHAVTGEANAATTIELLEARGEFARYGLKPVTGKKHQIRAHMAALGIPIVNDRIYPRLLPASKTPADLAEEYAMPLQLLAKRVEFLDPVLGISRSFESRRMLEW